MILSSYGDFVHYLQTRSGLTKADLSQRAGYARTQVTTSINRGVWPPLGHLARLLEASQVNDGVYLRWDGDWRVEVTEPLPLDELKPVWPEDLEVGERWLRVHFPDDADRRLLDLEDVPPIQWRRLAWYARRDGWTAELREIVVPSRDHVRGRVPVSRLIVRLPDDIDTGPVPATDEEDAPTPPWRDEEINRPDLGTGVIEVRGGLPGTWATYYGVSTDGTRWTLGYAVNESDRPVAEQAVRELLRQFAGARPVLEQRAGVQR